MRETARGIIWSITLCCAALGLSALGCGGSNQRTDDANSSAGTAGAAGAESDGGGESGGESASAIDGALTNTRPTHTSDTPIDYYRLDLMRDAAGAVTLSRIGMVESSTVPHPPLAAEYVAVARGGDGILSAIPLIFPGEMKVTTLSEAGAKTEESTAVEDSSVAVYIPNASEVDAIDVVDSSGESLLSLTADDLSQALTDNAQQSAVAPPPSHPGTISQPLTSTQLALKFPHILYLEPGNEEFISTKLLDGDGYLIARTDTMNDLLAQGLEKLTPAVLSSITTVGVVRLGPDLAAVYGRTLGSTLVINETAFDNDQFENTLIHEATHCFTNLVDAAASWTGIGLSDWPDEVGTQAMATVSKYRLSGGFLEAWSDLHECSVEAGAASDYRGDEWDASDFSEADAYAAGFSDRYGSNSPAEDVAMYVETTVTPTTPSPGICGEFTGLSEVTPEVSVPFAKLTLLSAVGAISESAYNACVKGAAYSNGPLGISFPGTIQFDTNLIAGFANTDGVRYFDVIGSSGAYDFMIQLALENEDAVPLGMHRLDGIGLVNLTTPGLNGAYLANDDPDLARVGEQGFVLISEASSVQTKGFVFGLVLQNAVGFNTDYMPYGTIYVR